MTNEQSQADARTRLPALGAHGMTQKNLPARYSISAPFPKANSIGEVLQIAALVAAAGYKTFSPEQHEIVLRAAVGGEMGEIVGVDKAGNKIFLTVRQAAKGGPTSALWFCSPDYPFASSFAEQKARDKAGVGNPASRW